MKRKLYALFILSGAIGSLVLAYLFFFVYYTGTLTINSNVGDYRVELYSPGTAQKWIHECPDPICEIYDVSPFDYNISVIKADYKTKTLSYKVRPRGNESIVVNLEKQVLLETVIPENITETAQEKIQRIRDENLYYAKFILDENKTIQFKELDSGELELQYITNEELKSIVKFPVINSQDIQVKNIYSSENVHIVLGQDSYIFDTNYFRIEKLPEIKNLTYIKYDIITKKYIVVTSVGAFMYDVQENTLDYQYQFKDYINMNGYIIGIIYDDEDKKKQNFNISEQGNVIIKYSQADKTRKVIFFTNNPINELYQDGEQIFIISGNNKLELKNFD